MSIEANKIHIAVHFNSVSLYLWLYNCWWLKIAASLQCFIHLDFTGFLLLFFTIEGEHILYTVLHQRYVFACQNCCECVRSHFMLYRLLYKFCQLNDVYMLDYYPEVSLLWKKNMWLFSKMLLLIHVICYLPSSQLNISEKTNHKLICVAVLHREREKTLSYFSAIDLFVIVDALLLTSKLRSCHSPMTYIRTRRWWWWSCWCWLHNHTLCFPDTIYFHCMHFIIKIMMFINRFW